MDITDRRSDPLPSAGKLRLINEGGIARLLDANGNRYRLRPEAGTPVIIAKAVGVLTLSGNAVADETVTIGDRVYTWKASAAAANQVKIGASAAVSCDNLNAAINGDAGAGTLYGTGTVAHALVDAAVDGFGDTVLLAAKSDGPSGNTIATTETMTAGAWGAATLTGGAFSTEAMAGDQMFDGSFLYTAVADVLPTSTSGWEKSATAAI